MTLNVKDASAATVAIRSATHSAETVPYHAAGETTSVMYDGTVAVTPKFASISAASTGDNTLVAGVSSKKIRVLSAYLVAGSAVTARFQTAAAGAYLSGSITLSASGGFVLPYNPVGWMETVASDLLNLELGTSSVVGGGLTYVEVS